MSLPKRVYQVSISTLDKMIGEINEKMGANRVFLSYDGIENCKLLVDGNEAKAMYGSRNEIFNTLTGALMLMT